MMVSNTLNPFDGDSTQQPPWAFLSTENLDLTSSFDETKVMFEEQWFNVNQSQRRAFLSWKRIGANYILTSEPRCIRQMCSVKLKYNGTIATRSSGCLSFSLRTRGQPGR